MRRLIERHSPMVLGVCRRSLGNHSESEDAAQAVFLVLWKKADSLTSTSIGGWLHHTALLICRNAIRSRRTRQTHEQQAAEMQTQTTTLDETDWSAIREALDTELDLLPEKYRVPLILFHLEGHTQNEIAERMSVAGSTVSHWLARARELLAKRLVRRGITVGGVVLASGLSSVASAGTTPPGFVISTVTAAQLFDSGHLTVAGGLSSSTSSLASEFLSATLVTPLKYIIAGAVGSIAGCSLIVSLFIWTHDERPNAGQPSPPPPTSIPQDPTANEVHQPVTSPSATPEESETDPLFGGIKGQILCDVPVPRLPPLIKGPTPQQDIDDESLLIDPQTSGISNVFVFIKKPPKETFSPLKAKPITPVLVDNIGSVFRPHAFVARTGQPITFLNGSTVSVNIHTFSAANPGLNFVLTPMNRVGTSVSFTVPETHPVKIVDDIHAWASCHALVLDHPYGAVTDARGHFRIHHLPTGIHHFRIWHERVGYISRDFEVQVTGGTTSALPPIVVPSLKLIKQ